MFSIISTMFLGIGIGYVLRNWSILQKIEKTISLTIFLLLFILGVSIGSNSLIVNNLDRSSAASDVYKRQALYSRCIYRF